MDIQELKIMRTLIKENTWLSRDYMLDFGWGNGYVIIPEGHPLHGKDYDSIDDIEIHGGLTYSELITDEMIDEWDELTESDKGMWMIGFDTVHYNDSLQRWPKHLVQMEADNLLEQVKKLSNEPERTSERGNRR